MRSTPSIRPREIGTSSSRRLCRFLLTSVVILGFTAVFTIFQLNQPPKRYQKVWITKENFHNVTGFLDRMAPQLNSIEWQCPCKATNVITAPKTEAHLVDFFLIKRDEPETVKHVNSIKDFCSQVSSGGYLEGFNGTCYEILEESFRLSGWDFQIGNRNLYMNSLRTVSLNPISFMFDVCMSWAGGLSQASSFYLISHFGLTRDESDHLNKFIRAIKISLETCAKHTSWPPPTNSLYLEEATSAGCDSEFGYVVAMSFNWTQYFSICAPSYCEHVKLNSYTWILFTALAQVGGFVSVALFVLRSVIWPLFCMIFGWPSNLVTCEEKGDEA
ncbi:uncharacterized protein LOC131248028 isoform X2 [Magnolia sinica]|uniref:uncharacterized protein LOC131248028 isoform X2 n=1 Tax=Magnolia sinica TaxID=86752 RepID=UPI002658F104|nr:uncharacterized protein LOC131248028 isoform X2 [Magnolia sinica]